MNLLNDLKYRYQYASPILRLIIVNALFFLVAIFIKLGAFFMVKSGNSALSFLALPSQWGEFFTKPWTIITYQFSHLGLFHFAFNMLVLYFSGAIFMDFFRKKDAWKVYIWGGVSAALLFMIMSNYTPVFRGVNYTLIGASGSVMAILFAATIYAPNLKVNLFGILPIKLMWIAITYLVMDLISIPDSNAGGHIAHIGGAIFGCLFALYRKDKIQIKLFEPVIKQSTTKKKFKVEVNQNTNSTRTKTQNGNGQRPPTQDEIDAILDKISKSGYDRLSKEEKDILFKASQD
jgi:membrane associated rhomboid family serine protease